VQTQSDSAPLLQMLSFGRFALGGDMRTAIFEHDDWPSLGSVAALVGIVSLTAACSRDAQTLTPQQLQQQYGIADAYRGQVTTPDGALRGTLVPVTLPDGRKVQVVLPERGANDEHAAYISDEQGLHPVEVEPNATREQFASAAAPRVVSRRVEAAHRGQRSWEKELLIVGGTAGAGTAVGALTGGKKGAGIGAAAGGVGGLIYDLTTRKHP
jgi:hypothetical protein